MLHAKDVLAVGVHVLRQLERRFEHEAAHGDLLVLRDRDVLGAHRG